MVAHACNPSTQEAIAGGLLQGSVQPDLHGGLVSNKLNAHTNTHMSGCYCKNTIAGSYTQIGYELEAGGGVGESTPWGWNIFSEASHY